MKKTLALFMTLALMLTCITGFAFNSSAEGETPEYVEPSYSFELAMQSFGNVDGIEQNPEWGSYDSEDGFFFDDVWTFEYWDHDSQVFAPMAAYFRSNQPGMKPSYGAFYMPYPEVGYSENGLHWIAIWNKGKYYHPGTTGGPVVTFIVPADGTISYSAAWSSGGNGNYATLWVNDEMIFPADGNLENAVFNNNSPITIEVEAFKVKAGDRVRLRLTTVGGNRSGKGSTLSGQPVVTYIDSAVSIGNPNGEPPTTVTPSRVGKDTSDTLVTWNEGLKAVSYNLYIKESGTDGDPVKVNDAPITETSYTVTGLKFNTLYQLTVTSLTKEGTESAHSEPAGVKTPKAPKDSDKTSDTSTKDTDTSITTNTNTNTNTSTVDNTNPSGGFPWWIVIVAAVVVIIVVILVLVLGKKKKPAEVPAADVVPVEETPVEEAPAEETPSEEAPAEEAKDEE